MKSSSCSRLDLVPFAQKSLDFLHRLVHCLRADRLHHHLTDGFRVRFVGANDFLCRGGNGQQDDVVLVLSCRRLTFWRQNARDGEGHVLDDDRLAGRIAIAEQVFRHGFTENSGFRGRIDILCGEEVAGHHGVIAKRHVIGCHALNRRGPVVASVDDLNAAAYGGRCHCDGRTIDGDGLGVVLSQAGNRAGTQPDAVAADAARQHDDQIASDAADLLLDAFGGSRADADHRDHGRNADDDAEHREGGTHAIHLQRAECDSVASNDSIHDRLPSTSARPAPASDPRRHRADGRAARPAAAVRL